MRGTGPKTSRTDKEGQTCDAMESCALGSPSGELAYGSASLGCVTLPLPRRFDFGNGKKFLILSHAESYPGPRLCNAPPGTMIDLRLSLGVWPSSQHEGDWFGST